MLAQVKAFFGLVTVALVGSHFANYNRNTLVGKGGLEFLELLVNVVFRTVVILCACAGVVRIGTSGNVLPVIKFIHSPTIAVHVSAIHGGELVRVEMDLYHSISLTCGVSWVLGGKLGILVDFGAGSLHDDGSCGVVSARGTNGAETRFVEPF